MRTGKNTDLPAILDLISRWPNHFVKAAGLIVQADFAKCRTLIWESNGCISGFIIWDTDGTEIEMKWLVVDPAATRRGIGRALINAVLNSVTSEKRVFLRTATTDSVIEGTEFRGASFLETYNFFERMGFKKAGILPSFWGKDNHAQIFEKRVTPFS